MKKQEMNIYGNKWVSFCCFRATVCESWLEEERDCLNLFLEIENCVCGFGKRKK